MRLSPKFNTFASGPRGLLPALFLLLALSGGLWLVSRAAPAAHFLPHWYCFAGNARVLWTSVIADVLIGLSYSMISVTLAVIVRRSGSELPYHGFFWAFGVFIVSCALTHFLEVVTVWKPVYWLSAGAKVVTAAASIGTAAILLAAAADIVKFTRTARALATRRADAKFRAVINASPLAVLSLTPDGMVTSWNPGAQRIFGYSEREAIGNPNPCVPASRLDEHLELLTRASEGATISSYETLRQRRDGSQFAVNISAAPMLDENGQCIGVMSVIEDISERKRMELELLETTGMLSAVTQVLNIYLEEGWDRASGELLSFAIRETQSEYAFLGVVMEDGSLRMLANDGTSWDETIHHRLHQDTLNHSPGKVDARDASGLGGLFAQVIFSGLVVTANHPDPSRDGLPTGFLPLQTFLGVPVLRGHEVAGVIGVANRAAGYTGQEWSSLEAMSRATGVLCEDYRQGRKRQALEQKQAEMEAQIRHAQKMEVLGRLAGGVAHDFNNMLMVLSGSAELLDRSLPPDALSRIYLEQIQRSVTRSASITRQLLAFSRKQVLDIRPMDLHAALREAVTMLPALLGADIEIDIRTRAERPWLRSDSSQIEQVLINLAVNARDAMPRGGRLTIATENSLQPPPSAPAAAASIADWLILRVEDHGHGMTRLVLSHIFEPFFTTKPAGKGTGLGLSTVYGIVRQSGGYIHVQSEPDKGTRFALYFPTIASPQPSAPSPPRPPSLPASDKATLLLVDDESALRHAIGEILRESGYTVLDAPSSQAALDIAREHAGAIDILVTDVVMPGLRGPELHQRILEVQPHIQVLFMSGYAEGLPETQLPRGAAFLQKPFSFASLLQVLRSLQASY